MKRIIFFFLISLLILNLAFAQEYKVPHNERGPAVDRIIFKAFAIEIAPTALEKGDMDIYFFSLRTQEAKSLLGKEDVKLYQSPASMISLILNPAPAPKGEINPFSIREVRYALQYLIDRDFITSQIYRGLALPMYTHVSPLDYDYLVVKDIIAKSGLRYDPDFAMNLIKDSMVKAGAEMKDGKWYYNGKPIVLKFIIRVEDERREVGDYIATQLTKVGFQVERIYQQFGPAIFKVYSTDPKVFEWHLYTEGWSRGAVEKYDFASVNQFLAPWMGNMPGWKEYGFWQYENKELDEIGQRIFKGEFNNLEERNDLYRKAVEIGINESVRIWLATVFNNFPSKANLQGVTTDMVAGPKSIWTLRSAYLPNRNDLVVGNLWVWTERSTWNPIGGFGDVYSVDIWNQIRDPPLWRHPFTGLPIPFRANYKVETKGPDGYIVLPPDAFTWGGKRWVNVKEGTKAKSKVIFNYEKYLNSKWHHGIPISMGDILYNIYQSFDLVYNEEKSKIEVALATTSKPYLDSFKGFRILNSTSLEVYVDFWHFIPDYIAEYSSIVSLSMPWEILYAMDDLVFVKRRAAYSDTASQKFNVPWISLVMDDHARLVLRDLREFETKRIYPKEIFEVNGKSYVSLEEALKRYQASQDWFNSKGHMVISNGPFFLNKFDPANQFAELLAYRDESYPFKAKDFYFGVAKIPEILEIEEKPLIIGKDNSFEVSLEGKKLHLLYSLYDPLTREKVYSSEAKELREGKFIITLPSNISSKLKEGRNYELVINVYSDEVTYVVEKKLILKSTQIEEKPLTEKTTTEKREFTTPQQITIKEETTKPREGFTGFLNTLTIGIIVGVVLVVTLGFIFLRRKV
ncbi:hypothetical protein HRbin06_00396 [archaeon HR06]|nr:hypothetical protein HRbin06_00396 [archaeon HR06]